MRNSFFFFLFIFAVWVQPLTAQQTNTLSSPNGKLNFSIGLSTEGIPNYSISYRDKTVISPSILGISNWQKNLVLSDVTMANQDTVWKPVYGERSSVRDHFKAMDLRLRNWIPSCLCIIRGE